jgi:hypothetical protein
MQWATNFRKDLKEKSTYYIRANAVNSVRLAWNISIHSHWLLCSNGEKEFQTENGKVFVSTCTCLWNKLNMGLGKHLLTHSLSSSRYIHAFRSLRAVPFTLGFFWSGSQNIHTGFYIVTFGSKVTLFMSQIVTRYLHLVQRNELIIGMGFYLWNFWTDFDNIWCWGRTMKVAGRI